MVDRSPAGTALYGHKRMKENLNRLQTLHNDYSHKIGRLTMELSNLNQEEHALHSALEKLSHQLTFKSLVSKKVFFGKDCKQQCDASTQKELYLSQMKLHSRKTRLSMLRHGNRILKSQITECRLQKNKAVADAGRLRASFERQSQEMADELNTANGYQSDNLHATEQLEAWLEKANNNMKEFELEAVEKQKILSAFRQREEFVQKLASRRLEAEGKKMQQTGQMSVAEERAVREKMYKLSNNMNKNRRSLMASHEKLLNYETAFKILREHTGEQDISKIVQIFIDREDDCFGMYTFLQRLNTQIQNDESQSIKVLAQIAKLTEELEESKKTNHRLLADVEKKRDILLQKVQHTKQTVKDFQEKINLWGNALQRFLGKAVESSEIAEAIVLENYPELRKFLSGSKSHAQRAVTPKGKSKRLGTPDSVRGSRSPRLQSLQPKLPQAINDKNILQTLSLVEMMATEIVEIYSSSGVDKSLKKVYKFGLPAPPHPRRSNTQIITRMDIPSFENWFDNDDERAPARPFSVEMLRQNISRGSPHRSSLATSKSHSGSSRADSNGDKPTRRNSGVATR